jgi:hypothetical protein
MTTKITPSVLENTTVSSGTYGGASVIPVFVVDAQGRITSSANITPVIATNLLLGTISASQLAATSVTASSVGSADNVARFTVDAQGRITSANSVAISITTSQISNFPTLVASATTDTSNASNISSGTLPAARLPNTAVTATSVGSASNVARFTVDSTGRITSANSVAIAISSTQVSGLASSATTDTSNASNISSGTLPAARLPNTAVTATSVGSATAVPRFTVDSTGRITSANSVAISLAAGSVSGLATVATSGSYADLLNKPDVANATIITTGTLAAARLGTTGAPQFGSLGVGTAASGTTGEIRATNNITAYFSSDKKFKENVRPIDGALEKVEKIGGKLFDWTDEYLDKKGGADGYFVRKSDFGVIAQDVQSVFPEAVRKRPDDTLAVDYEKLCALAFQAIIELKEKIDKKQ